MKDEVELILAKNPLETFCYQCRQLRLWLKSEKPEACGNCGSPRIEVDVIDSPRLTALRFGIQPDETSEAP